MGDDEEEDGEEVEKDDDLQQESKFLLEDSELHKAMKTSPTTPNADSDRASPSVAMSLDEKENGDSPHDGGGAEMKNDDETVIDGGPEDGEDSSTAMDNGVVDNTVEKTLEKTQFDSAAVIAQDENGEMDTVARAISVIGSRLPRMVEAVEAVRTRRKATARH